jgi:hypothetical protein
MWFKGVLTSKKLGTPIDSELLIYCLQADYILSCIWVYSLKSPCSPWTTPLLLSTMDATSTMLVVLLHTVDVTACLLVMLLFPVVMTPQPLDTLLCFVYTSLQSIADQLLLVLHGVNQLLLEFSGSHSKLHLLSMTHCSIALVMSACLVLV